MMKGGGGGREGDWECSGCANRNYAFRCYCNRCKQPRILVDHKTPAHSKWLPRIGDWICSGCTNNNYASREKCKKCGQPKEVAAVPAVAVSAASLPTHPHYFARVPGLHQLHQQKISLGYFGNGAPQQSLPLTSGWPSSGGNNYGVQAAVQPVPAWPLSGIPNNGIAYANQANQLMVQKGWRNGDWICKCGFHNYSTRLQCKRCDGSMPPAIGTKRLASEETVQDSDNKRLNAGHTFELPQAYPSFEQNAISGINQTTAVYPPYPGGSSSATTNLQVNVQLPQLVTRPALLGKGARQWRVGDWMCRNCNNHNYASRAECNRCKTKREVPPQPVTVDVSVA